MGLTVSSGVCLQQCSGLGFVVRKGEEYDSQVKLMRYFGLEGIRRRKDTRRIVLIYPALAVRAVSYIPLGRLPFFQQRLLVDS